MKRTSQSTSEQSNRVKNWEERQKDAQAALLEDAMRLHLKEVAKNGGKAPHGTFRAIHAKLGAPGWLNRHTLNNEMNRRKAKKRKEPPAE